MKLKRSLSILLTVAVILSTLTFAIPVSAQAEESLIDYIYYNDFTTVNDAADFRQGTNYAAMASIYEGDNFITGFEHTSDGTVKINHSGTYKYSGVKITGKKANGDIPKLIVSYRIKPCFTATNDNWFYGTFRDERGSSSVAFYNRKAGNGIGIYSGVTSSNTWDIENKLLSKDSSFNGSTWYNITLVYDNDSTDNSVINKRDIYIDGVYKGTHTSLSTVRTYNYATTGVVDLINYFSSRTGDYIEFDDFKAYEYPSELKYEVSSALEDKIVLTFNMIPNIDTVIKDNFEAKCGLNDLSIKSVEVSADDPRQVVLTIEEKLQPGTSYSVAVKNITAGKAGAVGEYMAIDREELKFETKPYKVYAENLKLYDTNGEVNLLSDGTYKVKTNFINESNENLTPVIAAGLYDENNELKGLQLIPVEDTTLPIEKNITLSGTSGLTLKLFMLKDIKAPETVSAVSVYTETSKDTDKVFDPEVKMLRDNFDIETVVNGDTQVITTKVSEFSNKMERPATLMVLKKGKTLNDIDLSNPMGTIVALNSVNLTESGISYKIADVTNDYEAYIYLKNSDAYGYKTFTYFGKAFMDTGLATVKDITKDEVGTFIADYKSAINLDTTDYDLMTPEEKILVAASIEAQREEKETKEYANFEEFIGAFNTSLELTLTKNDADIISIINKLDESDCTLLYKNNLSSEAITALYTDLKTNKPLTMNTFKTAFENNVILKGIEKAENYTQTQTIIENTTLVTGIDLSVYNTLNETKPVIEAVSEKTFANYGLLKSAFDAAVTAQKTVEDNVVILPPNTQSSGVTVGGGGGGTAVIPSPMKKTEISKDPEATEIPIIPVIGFNDLSGFDWAKDAINNLYEKGIINGVSASSYNPSGEVKREEFVKMIDTLYSAGSTTSTFTDVNQSEWYAPYINKAVAAGIIKGMNENTFGLGQGVTREDMAVMIVRALKLETNITGETFKDDLSIADYAKEAVYTLRSKGIISGTGNGNYEPKRIMTRAEAAVLINNILNVID